MQNVLNLNFDPLPSQQHHGLFEISATIRPSPLLVSRTQIHLPVICARKAKRGYGHQKIAEILPRLAFSMASKLNLLPEPLGLILAEFSTSGDGDGKGGSGSWKGFGGGSGWGRWRGKRNSFVPLGLFLVSGVAILLFSCGKVGKDLIIGVLASALVSAILVQGFGRGAKDWLLGFCIFGVGVALGSRRDDLQKLAQKQGFTVPSVLQLTKGRGISRRQSSRLW